MEQSQQDFLPDLELQVDHEARQHLNENSKWAKFISLTVFIFSGLLLIFAIAGSSAIVGAFEKISPGNRNIFNELTGGIIIGIIVFIVLILAFVYYFLYNFSVKIKTAMLNEDANTFNNALRSLKTYFIITAILSALALLSNIYSLFMPNS